MKTKSQLLKTASNLKTFSTKIKSAQDEEMLTPEAVKDMAMEIMDVAEVAAEIAEEIAENVPAEDLPMMDREERMDPEQIETAQDEEDKDEDKLTAGTARGAIGRKRNAQDEEDEDKEEKMAKLEAKLASMERKAKLAELAPKYASLFPKQMHEAKMNEIINSKQSLNIVEAKIQEASDIITNKTMVKVASMSDSIFSVGEGDSEEVNIAAKM
jgi:hypothetical protein